MLGDAETIIGVARYAIDSSGEACEFAIVIADAWQRRGIGKRMLVKLIDVARKRGLKRMYGDTLATNEGMLRLLRRLGFSLQRHPEDATLTRAVLALA
jgi:acetyltransferase